MLSLLRRTRDLHYGNRRDIGQGSRRKGSTTTSRPLFHTADAHIVIEIIELMTTHMIDNGKIDLQRAERRSHTYPNPVT